MTAQTYRNLEILVSDNNSTLSSVIQVVEELRAGDERIRMYRQSENIDPAENFRFVLHQATGEYFMWAADDDSWEPTFIEKLLELLERDRDSGVAFCNFDARDRHGRRADVYPDFLPHLRAYAEKPTAERLAAYIAQEEILGKANLIYGLFRRGVLESSGGVRKWGVGGWGADMLIVCSVLARANLVLCPSLLYHVGTEALAGDTPGPNSDPRLTKPRSVTVWSVIGLHCGYMVGYARIVLRTHGLTIPGRLRLFAVILQRLAILLWRDCAFGGARR
jgi:hypothetical protein